MVSVKVSGRTYDSHGQNAEFLNTQFSSEFTKVDRSSLPDLGNNFFLQGTRAFNLIGFQSYRSEQ